MAEICFRTIGNASFFMFEQRVYSRDLYIKVQNPLLWQSQQWLGRHVHSYLSCEAYPSIPSCSGWCLHGTLRNLVICVPAYVINTNIIGLWCFYMFLWCLTSAWLWLWLSSYWNQVSQKCDKGLSRNWCVKWVSMYVVESMSEKSSTTTKVKKYSSTRHILLLSIRFNHTSHLHHLLLIQSEHTDFLVPCSQDSAHCCVWLLAVMCERWLVESVVRLCFPKRGEWYDLRSDLYVITLVAFELCFPSLRRDSLWANKLIWNVFAEDHKLMDGPIENTEDLFHVIHPPPPPPLSLSFLSFMLVLILLMVPPPPHSPLSASALSSPRCLSCLLSVCPLCRLSGQSEVHATEYTGLSLGDRTDRYFGGKYKDEGTKAPTSSFNV